jgi:hypothetical protein
MPKMISINVYDAPWPGGNLLFSVIDGTDQHWKVSFAATGSVVGNTHHTTEGNVTVTRLVNGSYVTTTHPAVNVTTRIRNDDGTISEVSAGTAPPDLVIE